MSGIEVYQSVPPVQVPGSTRFGYARYWPPGAAAASGYSNYWIRANGIAGVATSNQGVGANFTYVMDAATQWKFQRWSFTGFSSLVIMVTESEFAGVPPLLATGIASPPGNQLMITRYWLRWPAGSWASANSGHVGGFWIGPAASGSITATNVLNAAANGYIGLVRSSVGMFWGYKPVGGAAVLTPLPTYDPTAWTKVEHRLSVATASRDAIYRLYINDVFIGQVSFANAGTPRYVGNSDGVSPILCQFNNGGFDTNLPLHWREWELVAGRDLVTTL